MLSQTGKVESEGNKDSDFTESELIKKNKESREQKDEIIESFISDSVEETLLSTRNETALCHRCNDTEDAVLQPPSSCMHVIAETDVSNLLHEEGESLRDESHLLTDEGMGCNAISGAQSTTTIQDIKKKIPGLIGLTLPTTSEAPEDVPNDRCKQNDVASSDSDSSEACTPGIQPLLRRISLQGRLKTRLQDPPPLTPAVQSQLTHCSSSLLRRKASLVQASTDEQQNTKNDGDSSSKAPSVSVETNVAQPISSLSVDSFNARALNFDEDHDPLDDDTNPKRKAQENKWIIFTEWFSLFLLVAFLACSMKLAPLKTVTFLGLHLWRWDALTLVIFCGRLISGWIMQLIVMLIEKHYLLKKRVLYFVYGLRRSVKNCVWLALVIGVWEGIFQRLKGSTALNILTKILWCLFTASISWMVKVLAVKVAANSFHRTAYFDRIQECVFNQFLLEKLSGPPTGVGIVDMGDIQGGHKKQLTRIAKKRQRTQVPPLHTYQDSHKVVHPPAETPQSSSSRSMEEGFNRSCILQKKIFVGTPKHTTVEVGEVPASPYSDTHASSRRASLTAQGPLIARSPIPIEQERLQELTSDTVSVWTLKRLMKLIRKTNMKTYSSILSQEEEDCEIGSEVQAKAAAKQEMNVLNTILLGPSNEKVYYPNALLSVKAISNCYRSPDQGDSIEFQINMNTPVEKLGMLKERMQRYIESLPQFWYPDFGIICEKIQDCNKMSMVLWMRHRLNFQVHLTSNLEHIRVMYDLPLLLF